MEGTLFYWFAWIGWVVSTFLLKKGNSRLFISAALLLFISGSNYRLHVAGFSVSVTFILLVFFSFSVLATTVRGWKLLYFLVSSLIITMGYVGFHLFELFDPVWLLFDRRWMLSVAIVYLTLMLIKESLYRLIVMIIAVCNGEILYTYILKRFSFPYETGALHFLDVIAMMTSLVMVWNILEKVTMLLETHFQARTRGKAGL